MKKVCKTKEDFIFELHTELHRLGVDADNDIFTDFEEHFKASMNEGLSEEEICEKLGDVSEIARDYVDETEINAMVDKALDKAGSKSVLMSSMPFSEKRGISLKKPDRQNEFNSAEQAEAFESVWKNSEQIAFTAQKKQTEENPAPSQNKGISLQKPSMEDDILPDGTRISSANGYSVPNQAKTPSDNSNAASQPSANPQINLGKPNIPKPNTANMNIPPVMSKNNATQQNTSQTDNNGQKYASGSCYCGANQNTQNTIYNGGPILPEQNNCSTCGSSGVNAGGLVGAICIDIFVFSWALPALAIVICSFFGVPFGLLGTGLTGFFGFFSGGVFGFHPISNLLFGIAMLSLCVLAVLLSINMVLGFIKIIKKIIKWHIRLIKGGEKK